MNGQKPSKTECINLFKVSIEHAVHDGVGDHRAHGGQVTARKQQEEFLGIWHWYFLQMEYISS